MKGSWGVPIYSKTSCLKRLDLDLEKTLFEVEFNDSFIGKHRKFVPSVAVTSCNGFHDDIGINKKTER